MPLDTQQFPITRYWLATALGNVPTTPDIFVLSKQLSHARKLFLAGKNQLTAIRNWLAAAGVIETGKGQVRLSELGQLMAAQDAGAEMALTWWLFHLHLCVNSDSFPYSAFFLLYDSESRWMSLDDVLDSLVKFAEEKQLDVAKETVNTYFGGVAQTFQPGRFVNDLALVEERTVDEGRGTKRVRRRLARPEDAIVAYAVSLFQKHFYPTQATVEAREILGSGLARVLGVRDSDASRGAFANHHAEGPEPIRPVPAASQPGFNPVSASRGVRLEGAPHKRISDAGWQMAIASLRDHVCRLVASEMSPGRRYRCLILQAADLAILARLSEHVRLALGGMGREPHVVGWESFFDAIGALSCDAVRAHIGAVGRHSAVVLVGPLHYVDYWTAGVQDSFWSFLSMYSQGPGVVVVDTPRTEGVEGPFVARGTIPGTEIRHLRPRLVVTEAASL